MNDNIRNALRAIRNALRAMGYKESFKGKWCKPIGHQLFTFYEDKNEWVNWFIDMSRNVSAWERKKFPTNEIENFEYYLQHLKEFECFTRTDLYVAGKSEFHLNGD